jgi:tetratricopeptide (TPR) repeat protein
MVLILSIGLFFLFLHAGRQNAAAQDIPSMESGRVLTLVKGDQPAQVREPYRAVVADDGRLFLTDPKKGDVLWFDENFVWKGNLATLRPSGDLGKPIRTVLDSRGRIYVADADTREILVFADGALADVRGGQGRVPGKFGSLDDIAIDADDMLWAADADRRRLYVFTPDGLLERVVNGFGSVALDRPRLVALGMGGEVFVYDGGTKTILAGSSDGGLAWTLDLQTALVDGKELYDLVVDPTGVLFLLLRDDSRVVVVSSDGEIQGEIFGKSGRPRTFDRLTGLSINSARNVMLAVDQKDLVVQEMRLDYGPVDVEEPVHRTHVGIAIDTLDGRPVAVSPGPDATDGSDDRLLIRDAGGLAIVSGAGGDVVARLTIPGELPQTIAAIGTSDGFIVVDGEWTARIFSSDGALIGALPTTTAGGQLRRPAALAWRASDGAFAVYDRDDDEIQILDRDFGFLQRVGRQGQSDGEISKAVALAFDNQDRLRVLDLEGTRLQLFDRHGIFVASSPPPVIGTVGGSAEAGLGADAWGRWFVLDVASGVAVQLDEGRAECQVGAPWYLEEPRTLVVSSSGDMYVGGGKDTFRAIRFRCSGPPPAPLGLEFALSAESDGPALTWRRGLPGAASYEIRRGSGDSGAVIGRSGTTSFSLNREAWGREPGELTVRGVTADGDTGPWSEPVVDRITPAFRALLDAGDLASAEAWLREELAFARDGRRSDVPRLRAAYLESILGQKEYDRAASELRRFEAGMDPETAARLRMEIARSAVTGSIEAGAGDIALRWVGIIRTEDPTALSNIERKALELEADGDYQAATTLLVQFGQGRDLDDVELTRAVADVLLSLSRPYGALEALMAAGRASESVTTRADLDQQIFDVTAAVIDGVLDGTIPPAPGLNTEQEVEATLGRLRDYLTETGRGGAAAGGVDAGRALSGAGGDASDEMWMLRLGALEAKPRIRNAVDLEASDFEGARAEYTAILAGVDFLMNQDEIAVRSHLGALELASGLEDEARDQFERILSIDPDWTPDPDEFSPSVRDFVLGLEDDASATDADDDTGVDGGAG